MTTIAFDKTMIAADSMASSSFIEPAPFDKIFQLEDYLIAGAGQVPAIMEWFEWYSNGCHKDENRDDFR